MDLEIQANFCYAFTLYLHYESTSVCSKSNQIVYFTKEQMQIEIDDTMPWGGPNLSPWHPGLL